MTLVRPIRENVLANNNRSAKSSSVSESYMVPDQECASCGESSRGVMHWDCARDPKGRLLVKEER